MAIPILVLMIDTLCVNKNVIEVPFDSILNFCFSKGVNALFYSLT